MKNKCRKSIFLLFSSSRVNLFVQKQNCRNLSLILFCLCLSFRIKVKKRYLLLKKKSSVFSARVNDIMTSILSALHPFLTLPNDVLKRKRGTFFFLFQAISWKAQKGTFFCSWKRCSQKREKPWRLEVMLSKVRKRYLLSLKKCKKVFSSHGKPFRILLIDRCQPFGVILWTFLSEFTNPLVKKINIPCL